MKIDLTDKILKKNELWCLIAKQGGVKFTRLELINLILNFMVIEYWRWTVKSCVASNISKTSSNCSCSPTIRSFYCAQPAAKLDSSVRCQFRSSNLLTIKKLILHMIWGCNQNVSSFYQVARRQIEKNLFAKGKQWNWHLLLWTHHKPLLSSHKLKNFDHFCVLCFPCFAWLLNVLTKKLCQWQILILLKMF